jgi:hypothetical protein
MPSLPDKEIVISRGDDEQEISDDIVFPERKLRAWFTALIDPAKRCWPRAYGSLLTDGRRPRRSRGGNQP